MGAKLLKMEEINSDSDGLRSLPASNSRALRGISSMATRLLLTELCGLYRSKTGVAIEVVSVGGVDAAKRVALGETFDFVVLAADAIERLLAEGHLLPGSRVDLVASEVSAAVPKGLTPPDFSSVEAVKEAVIKASSIGVSTGPSGVALQKLFKEWGLDGLVASKLVVPAPGIPVGSLLEKREIELGFQQLSELVHLDGIDLVGTLPPGCQIVTIFSGAVAKTASEPEAVKALLDFMSSQEVANVKKRQGMSALASS
jgi:molybdate transport system substrate-binding protein